MLTKEMGHAWRWLIGGYGNIYFVIRDRISLMANGDLVVFLAGVVVLVVTSIL